MDYEIFPLAYTQVDWRVFNDVCQSNLGISPSRGVDASYLDIKDPAAYLGSIDMTNQPLENLRGHKCLHHFSISFIARLDDEAVRHLHEARVDVITTIIDRRNYLCVLTATIGDWVNSITGITKDSPRPLRWVMSRVYSYLQQTGLRELFEDYRSQDLGDGTLILCRSPY